MSTPLTASRAFHIPEVSQVSFSFNHLVKPWAVFNSLANADW